MGTYIRALKHVLLSNYLHTTAVRTYIKSAWSTDTRNMTEQ